uniref:prenyltransferase n=1 Tax=Marinilabilia sp. TaxID=2021252 RepID=UPI0025B8804C
FFGLMGVGGTFFLHSGTWEWPILLPATAVGLFSTGVLNLNNTRDIESDKKSGKKTLPVMMGRKNAAWYHFFLITLGWTAMLIWLISFESRTGGWLAVLSLPLYIKNIFAIFRFDAPSTKLDPELRNLSIGTLLFVLLYGIGIFLI